MVSIFTPPARSVYAGLLTVKVLQSLALAECAAGDELGADRVFTEEVCAAAGLVGSGWRWLR